MGSGMAGPGFGDEHPVPPLVPPDPETPAWRLSPWLAARLAEYAALERLPYPTTPDGREDVAAFERRVERMDELMLAAIRARCDGPLDMAAKMTVLCGRLRRELAPECAEQRLTYLLAESVRDALLSTLVRVGPPG